MMISKPVLESYNIAMALQAIRNFISKNNDGDSSILKDHDVVDITICWREGTMYEWTPCAKGFRRILFVVPKEHNNWRFVIVFGYDHWNREVGEKLTDELNDKIKKFARWEPPKK
jgi:hypothetical protein